MTKSFHIVIFLIVLVFCGCNSSSVSEDNKGVMYKDIPSSAYAVAENDSSIVFLNFACLGLVKFSFLDSNSQRS